MKLSLFKRQAPVTKYVSLDTHKCKACWECISACPNQVINRVNLPWHKHALIKNPEKCTGCQKCIKTCQHGAFAKFESPRSNYEN